MVLKMYVHCDNEAVVQCVNKGRSYSPALSPFLKRLKWIVACDQSVIVARHVAGSENQITDSLSRFLFQKFRRLAPEADEVPSPVPPYSDLTVLDSETISFLIKQSKTDQVKKGHLVYIFNLSSPIQPYQAVREYLHLRISQAKSPLEPLFLDHAGKPVSRTWFQKQLKSVLLLAGISAANFSSHSFRIGAATSAAQKGLTKHQIQTLGRWSSEAFQSYIRTDQFHIKSAHQTLVS